MQDRQSTDLELFKITRVFKDTIKPRTCFRPTEILESESAI